MSVGGYVIKTQPMQIIAGDYPGKLMDVIRLWVQDQTYPITELAVYANAQDAADVKPGDQVWWQAGRIYWTPVDRRFVDKPLRKIAYSFDPRAAQEPGERS